MSMKISEQQFVEVYNKHKANKFTRFMYEKFGSEKTEGYTIYHWILFSTFIILNIIGFITKILTIILIPNILLGVVVTCGFIAAFMNISRINKIKNELNISNSDYDMYSSIYKNKLK
jgi:hypothetical protein